MTPRPRYFRSPEDFRAWLAAHGDTRDELVVGFWKKHTGRPSLTWPQSVDEALCHGWIDGIRRRVDDDRYTIRFTPRRYFESLPPGHRRTVLRWVVSAKRPETRDRRFAQLLEACAAERRLF